MNDHHLSDWLTDVLRTLESRRKVSKSDSGPRNEIGWYIDAIKAARQRIITLEAEIELAMQPRDTIALQFLTSGSALGDDPATAMAEAFRLADLFLEARKVPTTPTFVPDSPL